MAGERSRRRNFVFVPVTTPGERADAQTRRLIRSHPQLEHNRLHPRPSVQSNRNIIELDVTPLLENSQSCDGLITALSAHRSDPFVSFDIGPSYRSHQLWDHGLYSCLLMRLFHYTYVFKVLLIIIAYDGTCPKFRALNTIGFLSIARETIAISQMLASSAWHLVHHLQSDNDRGEDVRYSLVTTRSLQQKLDNPLTCTSDEVVITVLAMAAYAVCLASACMRSTN